MNKLKKTVICFVTILLYGTINLKIIEEIINDYMLSHNYFPDNPEPVPASYILIYILLYIPFNYLVNKFLLTKVVEKGDEQKLGIILNVLSTPIVFVLFIIYLQFLT